MEVNMRTIEVNSSTNALKTADINQFPIKAETTKKSNETIDNNTKDVSQLSCDDVDNITQELNKFLQLMNTDLVFKLHEGTKQLMVQVVDTREQKVLKEFPPHELLDTLAKISDYVGLLLDKKI